MILAIGEILADMIGEKKEQSVNFAAYCGGAPFNLAVNAKQAGAKVGFVGRVGKDPIGKFVEECAKKAGFDYLKLQKDNARNTTIAFVTLENGERDFAFYRHDTADYNIDVKDIDFDLDGLNIIHCGSLMLSEDSGVCVTQKICEVTQNAGKLLSFDVNFRKDIYRDFNHALAAYKPFVDRADIIKFSEDEILDYTGESDLESAISAVYKKDRLLLITLGSKGSAYYLNGKSAVVPTVKVKPVDTTGAGDAFFGAFLANIEGREWTEENLVSALEKANKAGADATQFYGAVRF